MNFINFLSVNKVNKRRTRNQIKKLLEPHKIEVKNVSDVEITCDFNSQEMKVKIHEEKKEVVDVSCNECKDFCEHKEILILYLSNKPFNEHAERFKRRRSDSGEEVKDNKKIKTDDDSENTSTIANVQSVQFKEIKVTKKKKKEVNLSPEELQQIEDVGNALKMENMIKSFGRGKYEDFYKHCIKIMNDNIHLIEMANKLTVEQADTDLWHALRIGRVTASRLYETTRCTTKNGSLIDKYLGKSSGWSFAMMRGTFLEDFVFKEVQKDYPTLKRCGLIMNPTQHPFFAASPDGLHEDFVLEIKCPGTSNTFQQYTNVDLLNKKYFAQIQLQMFVTGKTKALLAVAHLDFETTRKITTIWIEKDKEYVDKMIEDASIFYEEAIFPALKKRFL